MSIDVDATIAGLEDLGRRVDEATQRIVTRSAHVFQALAMKNAPIGDPENSTNEPGDLSRSMDVQDGAGIGGGDGVYMARMGPTVTTANPGRGGEIFNYGRQREFGGEISPNISPNLVYTSFGEVYRRASVFQEGAHYLLKSRAEGGPEVEGVIYEELTVAVEGG